MASTIFNITSLAVIVTIVVTGFGCPDDWTFYEQDQTCLKLFGHCGGYPYLQSWDQAREKCQTYGGDLVIIRDENKNSVVATMHSKEIIEPSDNNVWIGIKNNATTGYDFKFVDGSDLGNYGSWNYGHRSSSWRKYCVTMGKRGWFDTSCYGRKPYVCSSPSTIFNNISGTQQI